MFFDWDGLVFRDIEFCVEPAGNELWVRQSGTHANKLYSLLQAQQFRQHQFDEVAPIFFIKHM